MGTTTTTPTGGTIYVAPNSADAAAAAARWLESLYGDYEDVPLDRARAVPAVAEGDPPGAVRQAGAVVPWAPAELRACHRLVRYLMGAPEAQAFLAPVDPVRLGVPQYPAVVRHPMDLGAVRLRLELYGVARPGQRGYAAAAECARDVRLTFHNALAFNPRGALLHTYARALLRVFERHYARIRADPAAFPRGTAAALRIKTEVRRTVERVLQQQRAEDERFRAGGPSPPFPPSFDDDLLDLPSTGVDSNSMSTMMISGGENNNGPLSSSATTGATTTTTTTTSPITASISVPTGSTTQRLSLPILGTGRPPGTNEVYYSGDATGPVFGPESFGALHAAGKRFTEKERCRLGEALARLPPAAVTHVLVPYLMQRPDYTASLRCAAGDPDVLAELDLDNTDLETLCGLVAIVTSEKTYTAGQGTL